jgi:general secretion pathway protein G
VKAERTIIEMSRAFFFLTTLCFFVSGCAAPQPATPKSRAEADLRSLNQALVRYHRATHRWPSNGEGLAALRTAPDSRHEHGFIDAIPHDPWGNQYQYRFNPAQHHISIWSMGENLVDDADDIRLDRHVDRQQ